MARPGSEHHARTRMNIAVVDIGTNTVLLLVASFDEAGVITPVIYEQRVPRLGKDVDEQRVLRRDSMERVVDVLREYKKILRSRTLSSTVVCATSAVRDAANRLEFVRLVRQATGLEVEILSGEDEALWTYRGAVSGLPGIQRATVVDIGGGSTEISTGTGDRLAQRTSLDMGSVRLTERLFRHDPPLPGEIEAAILTVQEQCRKTSIAVETNSSLVAVAGTATSLALLAAGKREFSLAAVSGARLTLSRVDDLFRTLSGMTSAGIRKLSDVMEGRNDVITAGALILREVMIQFGFEEMIVSERGVRYGLAIREWERRGGRT